MRISTQEIIIYSTIFSFGNNIRLLLSFDYLAEYSNKKGMLELTIKQSQKADLQDVLAVERLAFGQDDEANLVNDLLKDPSAEPLISLLALQGSKPVGHILYTRAVLGGHEKIKVFILAPLAVIPEFQKMGIGQRLMDAGDKLLNKLNADLVFVLGHPTYYPKNGFINDAEYHGFPAPYPIHPKNADAWMFKALSGKNFAGIAGRISCCKAMDKEEYWEE